MSEGVTVQRAKDLIYEQTGILLDLPGAPTDLFIMSEAELELRLLKAVIKLQTKEFNLNE